MRILYAGDSSPGGTADYILAVLRTLRASVRHVPPADRLTLRDVSRRLDAVILSDMSAAHVPLPVQAAIARQVAQGTGLLMVGGWGSFSGPLGRWERSRLARLLPVRCLGRDDRVNLPGGALVVPEARHAMCAGLPWAHPPVICGFNRIAALPGSRVLLSARAIVSRRTRSGYRVTLSAARQALLVVGPPSGPRVAALATDLAPHWCGGLVDWGVRRRVLPVHGTGAIRVEVGAAYVRFVSQLVRWVAGR